MLPFWNLENLLTRNYIYSIPVFYWLQCTSPEHRTPAILQALSLCPSKGTPWLQMPQKEQAVLQAHTGSSLGQSSVQGKCSDGAGETARLHC